MIRKILEMPSQVLVDIMEEANAAGRRAAVANKLVALLSQRIADLEAERARRMAETVAIADRSIELVEQAESAIGDYRVRVFLAVDTLDPRCQL